VTREIITRALVLGEGLELFAQNANPDGSALLSDLRSALAEARALVSNLQRAPSVQVPALPAVQDDQAALRESFIAGVKAGLKPGLKRKG
jgi:hypothetical protein